MAVLDRVKVRLADETPLDEPFITEAITLVSDMLKLRLGVSEIPSMFDSIVVDAVVKVHRRKYYEGISSENSGGTSVSFSEDILKEYEQVIQAYLSPSTKTMVKFL